MSTYSNLLNEIKFFSKSKFNNVYTKSFFKNIILPAHNPQKKSFCTLYCDFNRLNDINTIYSESVGDELLANSYSKINSILSRYFNSSDFSISLLGGDEFLILVETLDREKIDSCFNEISSLFSSNCLTSIEEQYEFKDLKKHKPDFIDFSYGISYSDEKQYFSLAEMLHDSEERQAQAKILIENEGNDFYTSLKANSNRSISNFFKNFRFNNYLNFDISDNSDNNRRDVRSLFLLYINSLIKLLSNPEQISLLISKLETVEPTAFENHYSSFSEDQCMEIYNYIQSNYNLNEDYLDNFTTDELYSLLNVLIREAVSGCYNKAYFQKYFAEFFKLSNVSFSSAILVSNTNLKDSNLKLGHSATDRKMKLFSNKLQDLFEENTDTPFSKNDFNIDSNSNFIFAFGGGNYLILTKKAVDIPTISSILSECIKGCEPLEYIYSSENIQGIKDINPVIDNLSKTCLKKKFAFKNTSLDFNKEDIISTFHMFLAPTLDFYLQQNPSNPLDMKEIKKLCDIISASIIDNSSKYNLYDNCCEQDYSK